MDGPTSSGIGTAGAKHESSPRRGERSRLRRWLDDGLLRRIFKNAGVLLGGKAAAGLMSLGAVAVTARSLGPELFGYLILVHTYTKVVGGVIKFQSWQAVIRYGATSLEKKRQQDFTRLIIFTSLLDLGSAVIGAGVAVAAISLVGPWLALTPEITNLAGYYSLIILLMLRATPTGILRLFDRFDLLSLQSTVAAGVRLVGTSIAYALGAEFWVFLVVWFVAGAASSVTLLAMAWRELGRRNLRHGLGQSWRGLTAPHPRIWRFVWTTNLHGTLGLLQGHVATLMVGGILGPISAGLYKIASQFIGALFQLAGLLKRSIYPELAKLAAKANFKAMRRVALRAGFIVGSVTGAFVIGLVFFGELLLRRTVGADFVGAYGVLLLLGLSITIRSYGFPLDSTLTALGRPDLALKVNAVFTALFVPALLILLKYVGLLGAGHAAVGAALGSMVVMAIILSRRLAKRQAKAAAKQGRS